MKEMVDSVYIDCASGLNTFHAFATIGWSWSEGGFGITWCIDLESLFRGTTRIILRVGPLNLTFGWWVLHGGN